MQTQWTALALTALLAIAAPADTALPGVRFDLMPVGCRIHGRYSDGQQVVDQYIGHTAKGYVVKTFTDPAGKALIRTTTFNEQGFMIRKDWAGGKWETFAPFSCFDKPGACTYTYRNADHAQKQFRGVVTTRGSTVLSTGGFVGEAPLPNSQVWPGPFKIGDAWSDGHMSFKVTKYDGCGDVTPSS